MKPEVLFLFKLVPARLNSSKVKLPMLPMLTGINIGIIDFVAETLLAS